MRVPSSRSAWRTQFQIDCAVGSNSRDSDSGVRPPHNTHVTHARPPLADRVTHRPQLTKLTSAPSTVGAETELVPAGVEVSERQGHISWVLHLADHEGPAAGVLDRRAEVPTRPAYPPGQSVDVVPRLWSGGREDEPCRCSGLLS